MSDYLGRLVNRLFEPEAEIQPRLPGLFEPAPGSAWAGILEKDLDSDATVTGEPGERDQAIFSAPDRPGGESFPSPQVLLEPPTRHELEPAPVPQRSSLLAGDPPAQPPEPPAEGRPARERVPAERPVAVPPPLENDRSFLLERETRVISFQPAPRTEKALGSQLAQVFHTPAGEPPRPEGVSPRMPVSAIGWPLRPETSAAGPELQPPARLPQVEPAAAPRIQVTIGRIEVRAAPTAAPAPPRPGPARHGPTVSLQDYLKRRSGGSS